VLCVTANDDTFAAIVIPSFTSTVADVLVDSSATREYCGLIAPNVVSINEVCVVRTASDRPVKAIDYMVLMKTSGKHITVIETKH
jgi:hypothetical protein